MFSGRIAASLAMFANNAVATLDITAIPWPCRRRPASMGLNGERRADHRMPMDTGLRRYDRGWEAFAGANCLKTGIIALAA